MNDYDYSDRHMVEGWFDNDGTVMKVRAYYCQNGPSIDGDWNVLVDGVVCPGPGSTYPMYFIPELCVSVGLKAIHAEREDVVLAARHQLEEQELAIQKKLRALR